MVYDNIHKARLFIIEVQELGRKYGLPYFIVTDGASAIDNIDCAAVEHARKSHIEWELKHNIDPCHEWSNDITR